MAAQLKRQNQPEAALSACLMKQRMQELLTGKPDLETETMIAEIALDQGMYDIARDKARHVLNCLPHFNARRTRPYVVLMKAYFQMKMFADAEASYARAMDNISTHLGDSHPL